ncbi:hypothetical protein ACFU44_21115 [Nocardia rhizosphaerihabitans]|uniref:hypothetical protein n=1 Tax=Nocardia rhizosphaerihabitans TaxID=1691570 RepID=UPI00366F97DB
MKIFDTKAVVVLVLALLVACISAVLALAGGRTWPTALLVAGGAAWAIIVGLPRLIK